MYHSELIFLDLFNIYQIMTEEDSIDLDILERAFYTFQDLINVKEGINVCNDFSEELDSLLTGDFVISFIPYS